MKRRQVALVQQGVWEMSLESMPLAIGYLKAAVDADETLRDEYETRLVNLRGGRSIGTIISEVFADSVPDVLGISVFGWSFREAISLCETFKQFNPRGVAVVGGTHVANQGERIFRLCPEVDVVVNGEGEQVFPELLRSWLEGAFPEHGGDLIEGISFQDAGGSVVTTPARARIMDLDTVPSPFLSGALPMLDRYGRLRYDVAIMETNRGCPYRCAFCYWGGAIGQRVRRFSRERLCEELDFLAHHEVETVVLCDANFGMQAADEEFLDDLIAQRDRSGYPRAIEASWTKNKSDPFFRMVRKMKATGMHSSFTLALQTLNDSALRDMNRRNMALNDWHDLTQWLSSEGLECYAELIWGAPGETVESFLRGYDEISLRTSRIATYPLMILPNTEYAARREELGLVTTRGHTDDFEYVLATKTMTFQDNLEMQGFLLWARCVAENSVFRNIWRPLLHYAGLTQSQLLSNVAAWFDSCQDPAAEPLRSPSVILEPRAVSVAVRALLLSSRVRELLGQWWAEAVRPLVPETVRPILDEVIRFELLTLPVTESDTAKQMAEGGGGVAETVRRTETFEFDVPALVDLLRQDGDIDTFSFAPATFTITWRLGLEEYVYNHEEALHFLGVAERVTGADSDLARASGGAEPRPRA